MSVLVDVRFRSATYITSSSLFFLLFLICTYVLVRRVLFFFEEREPLLPSLLTKIHVLLLLFFVLIYMPRILELEDTSARNKSVSLMRLLSNDSEVFAIDQCWATLKIYIQHIRVYAIYTVWNSSYTKYWITQLKSHYGTFSTPTTYWLRSFLIKIYGSKL